MRGGAQRIPRPPGTRPGRPAPWADLDPGDVDLSLDRIVGRISGRTAQPSPVERLGVRASAVLAAFYEHGGAIEVVLTRRAHHLRAHSGEVAFPGGRQEPGESLVETALREAHEEVALDPATVQVVGELDHLTTVSSRSSIVPFVATLPGRPELVPEPGEVDTVLYVPLTDLLHSDAFREERWGVPPLDRPIHFFEIPGDTVWGATARMLRQFLAVVLDVG